MAPTPPPGNNHTSPSEDYWGQMDLAGARQVGHHADYDRDDLGHYEADDEDDLGHHAANAPVMS